MPSPSLCARGLGSSRKNLSPVSPMYPSLSATRSASVRPGTPRSHFLSLLVSSLSSTSCPTRSQPSVPTAPSRHVTSTTSSPSAVLATKSSAATTPSLTSTPVPLLPIAYRLEKRGRHQPVRNVRRRDVNDRAWRVLCARAIRGRRGRPRGVQDAAAASARSAYHHFLHLTHSILTTQLVTGTRHLMRVHPRRPLHLRKMKPRANYWQRTSLLPLRQSQFHE